MIRKIHKIIPLLLTALFVLLCFTACKAETVRVKINDMNVQTIVEMPSSATVKQAIDASEIELSEKDEVSPAPDTVLRTVNEINLYRYADVSVNHDGDIKVVSLSGGTVADAIDKAGIKLKKNEVVNFNTNAYLTDGMEIMITKCVNVHFTVDGNTEDILTTPCTVKEFLENQGVTVAKEDIITKSLKTNIDSDMELAVKRVTSKTVTETEDIKYETVYKTSSSMKEGTSKVSQKGKNGQKTVKYQITYIDGKESERKTVEETVISKPVDEIVVRGPKKKPANKGGKTIKSKQKVPNCNGDGHGYYIITWSDGSVTYQEY